MSPREATGVRAHASTEKLPVPSWKAALAGTRTRDEEPLKAAAVPRAGKAESWPRVTFWNEPFWAGGAESAAVVPEDSSSSQ